MVNNDRAIDGRERDNWLTTPLRKTAAFSLLFLFALCLLGQSAAAQGSAVVNFADVHQSIDGFGASDAWLGTLTDAQADQFFTTSSGIGLTFLRVEIDENGNKLSGTYSNATKAAARGAKVWAAPWSAPAAWKDNGSTDNGGHLLPAYYDAWATRLAGFAGKLQQNAGVPLYGLSPQNELDFTAPYVSMLYTNQELTNFVKVLGPKVAALNPRPKMIAPESAWWSNAWGYTSSILGDSAAAPYLDVIAAHQYAGVSAAQTTAKPIWQTEMSSFEGFDPSIGNALMVAQWIHDAIVIGNVSAWHYWWLYGHDSLNQGIVGFDNGMQPTKRFYTFGNFSKFVRPGFVVVGVSGGAGGVSMTAYKNPSTGAFVIIAINHNGSATPLSVSLNGLTAGSVTPWVTSSSLDLAQQSAVPVSAGAFTATLPASSVTSFVGIGGGGIPPPAAPTGLIIRQ